MDMRAIGKDKDFYISDPNEVLAIFNDSSSGERQTGILFKNGKSLHTDVPVLDVLRSLEAIVLDPRKLLQKE